MSGLSLPVILVHTPKWVFAVFAALLLLGWRQSRDRMVRRASLPILPVAMLGLSLHGIVAPFGFTPLPVLAWGFGAAAAAVLCPAWLMSPVRPGPSGFLQISGSWWPLALMMMIFCVRYVIGYAVARQSPIVAQTGFIGAAGFAMGLLGGVFLARAAAAWRIR